MAAGLHAPGDRSMDSTHSNQTLIRTVDTLTRVIDAADPHTRGRSLRIARYAVRVARELETPEAQLVDIELGALLHDIGRSAILNDVVQTPRALDAGERAIVQTHPTIGWEMLREIPGLAGAAEIVYCHHERPDGKGYPRGLAADHVPLGARLVMVCAAYDAMVEDRPYRRGLRPPAACEELRRHTAEEEDTLLARPTGHKLAPPEAESAAERLHRELRLEHVQIREISAMMRHLLGEKSDLEGARRLTVNLTRRWDAHTAREERELF